MLDEILYKTEVRFNAIYVLESLPPGELKTGEDLYDAVINPQSSHLPGAFTQYRQIQNRGDLIHCLTEIGRNIADANHHPILHLEVHGNDDGVRLRDGTFVPWTDMTPYLISINRACRVNLLVIAVACRGWSLTRALNPAGRAPVCMLIGPPASMSAGELLDRMKLFYTALIPQLNLNAGLSAANHDAAYESWRIKPATAEILFCRVFRTMIESEGSEAQVEDQVNDQLANLVRRHGFTVEDTARMRPALRARISDHRGLYDRLRETFLMLDIFPENAERFGLSYDLCFKNTDRDPQQPRPNIA